MCKNNDGNLYDAYFVEPSGYAYNSWDEFLKNAQFPGFLFCAPSYGWYHTDDDKLCKLTVKEFNTDEMWEAMESRAYMLIEREGFDIFMPITESNSRLVPTGDEEPPVIGMVKILLMKFISSFRQ